MKIEVGKYYKTRDGRRVGPMRKHGVPTKGANGEKYPFITDTMMFTEEGRWSYDTTQDSGNDLIAEWTDEEPAKQVEPAKPGPTLSSETIDHIAIDSLRWHYNEGKDMEPLQREAFRIVLRYYGASV